MRKFYLLLFIVYSAATSNAQNIANYAFTPTAGVYTALVGGTTVPSLAGDDVNSTTSIPLGFTFYFMGLPYTSVTANSNGWLSFNPTPTTSTADMRGNNLATAAAGLHPIIAPAWDDLDGRPAIVPNPVASYLTTGAAGSRVFTFEWLNWGPFAATVPNISFQAKLYEATGAIEFYYRQEGATNFTSASAGIGNSATSFASLSAFTAAPTISNVTSTNTLTTRPATGQVYSFVPPVISGGPSGLTFSGVSSGSMTLNWTDNATNESGYLIYRSLDGINYTLISGTAANATSSVQSYMTPSTLYFWRVVAVTEGSASAPASGSQTTLACGAPLAAGTYTVGPTGTYPNLTNALTTVSNGTAGPVILELQNTYTSAGETFPLVLAPPTCPAGNLTIRPQTGATGLVIVSNNPIATIDFNGGDNVTIDGRPGGIGSTSQLIISNSATGDAAAIRFINDATNNTVTYNSIFGSTTTNTGVMFFGSGVTTGNDGNTISNNIFGPEGANLPFMGIQSIGSSALIDNSNNIITGNTIADVFSPTTVFSAIYLGVGNSGWNINGNRIFQTAPRTVTTSNTATGISIGSGNGHGILNNTIGFANAAGTGTTTYNATVAFRYIGIGSAFTAGGTANSIQGNTIAGIATTTSSGATTTNGILAGINVTSGDVNIGTVTGNTIGATTGTGSLTATSTTTGGLLVGINSSSTGNVSIQNNTIGALTSSGVTATIAGSVTGINVSGVAASMNISNNTIGNTTFDNIRGGTQALTTGSSLVSGINLPSTSSGNVIINNNVIRNLSSYGTGTTGFVRGIWTAAATGSATTYTITNNQINTLTTTGGLTTITNGQTSGAGIVLGVGNNSLVSQNTIHTIANLNTTTTGNMVAGITHANATNSTISRNRIYGIINSGTSTTATTPSIAAGIINRSGTTNTTIVNNMISLGTALSNNTAFLGIQMNHGSTPDPTNRIYFNSINIEGAAASGAQPSFGIARTDFSTTARTAPVDIRNNLITNSRTGGTGQHFAIANNFGATASATGWGAGASDFNILNANAATVGWWTSVRTFGGWQTASAGDAASLSGVAIVYVNPASADLHIGSATSPVEGAGSIIPSVTNDFDNDDRSLFTPTDIGADAGNFFNYPAISFAPSTTSCTAGSRTLTTTITDVNGVPTAGAGLPVMYWRIGAGAYQAATATSLGGSQYQFTFGAGSVVGNTIFYYIVAQDNVGTVGSFPSFGAAGFTTNPPAAGTPPTTPLSFTILPTLSGVYTVGAAGTYPTLTAAVNAYNTSCLGGPVTFNLVDPTYPGETFPIVINANTQASAVNTLTIKPTVATAISGSSATGIIMLNGADYVTIDGSISNTPNTVCPLLRASRDMTVTNTNTGTGSAVIWLGSTAGNDPVTNTTIRNTIVIGNSGSTTIAGIGAGGSAIGTGGTDNDNLAFINNDARAVRVGIYSSGASAANKNEGLTVNLNTMTTAAPNNIGETGIYVAFTNNVTVSGNTVGNIIRTGSPDGVGINIGMGAVNGISATGTGIADGVSNVTITNNTIGVIENSGTFSSAGIVLGNTVTGTSLIANNMISGVTANGTAGDMAGGLMLGGGTGQVNVYNNTVAMQGIIPGATAASQISTAFSIAAGPSAVTVRNNIFSNNQVGNAGATLRFTAIALGYASPYTNFLSNNNDLFSAGPGPGTYAVGTTGGLVAGTLRNTLADWRTETGQDLASQNVLPVFVSATDLHLVNTLGTNWCLNGSGSSVPSVTNDIDCQTRNNPPDIGADEFNAISDAAATPTSQTICSGATITTIVISGSATSNNWTRDNTAGVTGIAANGSGNISGALTNITNAPITVTFTIIPVIGGCNGPAITATVLVNPAPTAVATPASQMICSGATITTIVLTGTVSGTAFNWTRDNTATVTGIAASGAGNISGALTNTSSAPVTVTFTITPSANGCTGTPITATVLVNPTPNVVALPTSQSSCSGSAITPINLTSSVAGTVFNWTRDNVAQVTGIAASGSGNITGSLTHTTTSPVLVTFTITPTANGCTGSPVTSTVMVNPQPAVTGTVVEPTTCVSSDGSITLTPSGAASYTYAWTGSGVNPSSQNQTGLAVGIYNVVVTANGGCTTSATFILAGPGGCAVCPTVGSVSTNPSVATCQNQPTTITASGLSGMGVTYGIQFKYSPTALADPYVGGTNIATVPNGSLTGGGTTATTNTSFPTAGSYFVYAILSPTPIDPGCRPSAVVNLLVNPTPNAVATPSSQTICSGATITSIALTGSVAGTTFNWTRDQTVAVTGIAASGSGNISGALTNTTTAPVVVTFTITPTANGCPGAAITATVTVNPIPTVNTVGNQTVCNGASTAVIAFSGAVAGTVYNWTNNTTSIGLAASGIGNIPSFTATNTGTTAVTATIIVTPTYTNAGTTCTGTPTTFTITVNPTPTVNAVANQTVCNGAATTAIVFSGAPAGTVFNWTNSFIGIGLASSGTGNIGAFLGINTGNSPVTSTITVTPSFAVSGTTCTGTPTTFTITVNPIPTVNVLPNQVVCPGPNTTQAIAPVGPVVGTVFNWTNSNPAIGLAASGTGIIPAFTAINTGVNPVTATITITPSYTNNGVTCTGPPRSFTYTVNSVPTVVCPANITVSNGANICGAIVTYPNATVTGTPAPQVTYSIPSGSQFPVGLTTVTVTANNSCGTATCSFTIRVNDTQAPAIFCPGNMTTTTPVGSCTAQVNYGVSALDNCGPVVITRTAGPASGSQFPLGTTTITHVATDVAGNTSTCSFTVTVFDGQLPVIFAQPSNRTVCQGTNATFTVAAGNIVSYQWQQWNGTAFVNIAGATASTYTVTNATNAMNTNTFRVVMNGLCTIVTSGNATLFVSNPASVTLNAVPPASLTPGFSTMLVATPSTGGGTYQWFRNGQLIANTGSTLGPITVDNQATYRVVYTDANGCIATSADLVVSAMFTSKLWVYPNPNRGQFQVRYFNAANDVAYIMIHDALGRKVHHQEASNGNPYSVMNVDLGFSANGIYIVSLVNGAGKIVGSVRINVQKFQ